MKTRSLIAVVILFLMTWLTSPAWAVYHAGLGRFLQRDPGPGVAMRVGGSAMAVGNGFVPRDQYRDGMSLYQYVRSRPTYATDSSGLSMIGPGDPLWGNSSSGSNSGGWGCCGGTQYNPAYECCIENSLYKRTEYTDVYVCWRSAQLPLGETAKMLYGKSHMWLKTQYEEVGLGEVGGNGAPDAGDGYPTPFPFTEIVDHSNEPRNENVKCVKLRVSTCCIREQMQKRQTGKRCGPSYNCNTYVYDSLKTCGINVVELENRILEMEKPAMSLIDQSRLNPVWGMRRY